MERVGEEATDDPDHAQDRDTVYRRSREYHGRVIDPGKTKKYRLNPEDDGSVRSIEITVQYLSLQYPPCSVKDAGLVVEIDPAVADDPDYDTTCHRGGQVGQGPEARCFS